MENLLFSGVPILKHIRVVGQGPAALVVGAGRGCSLVYHFHSFSLSLGDGPI